ncbi:MAG: NTP transferase domain-containing protein [Bacteroidales bacterium]|nr:NTP transferase domain-containing protein [Bacteroidales bacterium]
MKIIIPMAGMGKRMRPHTLTVPKPLINIAGKPIVQRLVEGLKTLVNEKIEEIAFVIGDFGKEVEEQLLEIAKGVGSKGKIYYQNQALGTAHAIYCANESISGKVIVAFADTLFHTTHKMDTSKDGIIWVHNVEDPSAFGVVKTNEVGEVVNFVEKPKTPVSNQAIVGVYYFKNGELLSSEIKKLIDNKIVVNGEYQLTDVLENMMKNGYHFSVYNVEEWLDCGNKDATVHTNERILDFAPNGSLISSDLEQENSIIIQPCYIGKNVSIKGSIVGPHVSIGEGTSICNSIVSNSIIQSNCKISNANIDNSMVGNYVEYSERYKELNIGDFTVITQ